MFPLRGAVPVRGPTLWAPRRHADQRGRCHAGRVAHATGHSTGHSTRGLAHYPARLERCVVRDGYAERLKRRQKMARQQAYLRRSRLPRFEVAGRDARPEYVRVVKAAFAKVLARIDSVLLPAEIENLGDY